MAQLFEISQQPVLKELPPHLRALVDLLPLRQRVHRSVLERAYEKSNYARRIRKIVSEYGWDIRTERGADGANDDWYTRYSDGPIRPQRIRYEVPKDTRKAVYARDRWKCGLCGVAVDESSPVARPQCDHKIPSDRGGSSRKDNLQTLCTRCNLKKRQECASCVLSTCQGCPYAYPESFGGTFVLTLDRAAAQRIEAAALDAGVSAHALIESIVRRAYVDAGQS